MAHNHPLVKLLEQQLIESDTSATEVGEQRERNHRYYTLQPLGNEQKGRSHHIAPVVFDGVENRKAIFDETFNSSREVVKFTDCPYPMEAEAKTAYVNRTFRRNKKHKLFKDGWHDAFVAKQMVVLAEWQDETKRETIDVQHTPVPVIEQQLRGQPDIVGADDSQLKYQVMPAPGGQMMVASGSLGIDRANGYVKYTLFQPERYYRDPDAPYGQPAMWETLEEEVSRGILIDQGYDRNQVDQLKRDYRFQHRQEDTSRKSHSGEWSRRQQHNRTDEQAVVSFMRTWTFLYVDTDDEYFSGLELGFELQSGFQLFEVHWSQGEVLRWADGTAAIKPVDESGIFVWQELPISHADSGLSTADVLAPNQKSESTLKRLILDNQQIANSSRLGVVSGGLKNPRDLLENKIGSPLWMKRPGVLEPIPHTPLSPFTPEALMMLKQDSMARAGINELATGMSTDVVKYQNADNMIERLTNAGTRRVTMAARSFAEFLIELAQYTVHLAMQFDVAVQHMEVAGQQVPIAPQQWQDSDLNMEVAAALTPEERKQRAQSLMLMHNTLAADPTMALCYGVAQKHALLDEVFDLLGISDTTRFMLAPSDPKFAQAAQQQGQQMAKEGQKQDAMLQAQLGHITAQTQNLFQDNQLKLAEFHWRQTDDMADNLREDDKLRHQKVIDFQELANDRRKIERTGAA